jgi:hypothetical protein
MPKLMMGKLECEHCHKFFHLSCMNLSSIPRSTVLRMMMILHLDVIKKIVLAIHYICVESF